jgi:hypothetical protein
MIFSLSSSFIQLTGRNMMYNQKGFNNNSKEYEACNKNVTSGHKISFLVCKNKMPLL